MLFGRFLANVIVCCVQDSSVRTSAGNIRHHYMQLGNTSNWFFFDFVNSYLPQKKLWEDNVFTGVCVCTG